MLFCKKCGAEVGETFRFCEKCFANLSAPGAVVNNSGIASAAAERAENSGNFLPDAFTANYDMSGCRIGEYRLSEKIGSYLGNDFYLAVNICNGRKAVVRYFRIDDTEYSDKAAILCGQNLNELPKQALQICKDECERFRKICDNIGIPCSVMGTEGFVSLNGQEGHLFIIMDNCIPLVLEMQKRSMTVREIIKIAAEICGYISEMERSNIVNNSIDESNIVVDSTGKAQLCAEFDRAMQRNFIVTPVAQSYSMYLPPDFKNDERCSVYSLAVMLYRLLNGGKPPYMNYFNKAADYSDFLRAEQKRNSFLELQLPANAENMLGNMLCSIIGNDDWRSVKMSDVRNTLENSLNYLSSAELDRKIS